MLQFHLRPYSQLGLDRSSIPSVLSHKEVVNELLSEIPEITNVSKEINQFFQTYIEGKHVKPSEGENIIMVEEPWMSEISSNPVANGVEESNVLRKDNLDIPSCLENITREDMEITLLGTGSSQPSKYRNVSSVFINLFARGCMLLDCGEGTLAQLKRRLVLSS